VNFSEQLPSKQWATLKFRGEKFAEVWFKPDGDPVALKFRIPQSSFQIPGMGQRLTTENLLKTVAIATEEVESWRQGDLSHSALNGSAPQLRNPLPPPLQDATYLDIYVRLMPPLQAIARNESAERETASAKWQDLEARWKVLWGLEATMDTLRISMEGLRAEMESLLKRMLTTEEKLNALAADVAQWNKAKSRVHYALPKAREFIHHATWAKGTPERKRLDELFKNPSGADLPVNGEKVLARRQRIRRDLELPMKDDSSAFLRKLIASWYFFLLTATAAGMLGHAAERPPLRIVAGKSSWRMKGT